MMGPGQGGIRLTLLKNGVVSYLNAVLGAPRQQLCLRQMLSSRFWRVDAVVFAESQNMRERGNLGVTNGIVNGHSPRTDAGITSTLPLAVGRRSLRSRDSSSAPR
jgi:hypothetical protein